MTTAGGIPQGLNRRFLGGPFDDSFARAERLQRQTGLLSQLPAQQSWPRPSAEGCADCYAEEVPDADKWRSKFRAMEGICQGAEGPRRDPGDPASQAQSRRCETP